jgi:hypothetical protein
LIVGDMVWHRIDVYGDTYYWTAYASKHKVGDGPWEADEYLTVSRQPDTAGMGAVYPRGTVVTEQHAIDLVRLARAHGRPIP